MIKVAIIHITWHQQSTLFYKHGQSQHEQPNSSNCLQMHSSCTLLFYICLGICKWSTISNYFSVLHQTLPTLNLLFVDYKIKTMNSKFIELWERLIGKQSRESIIVRVGALLIVLLWLFLSYPYFWVFFRLFSKVILRFIREPVVSIGNIYDLLVLSI